jgi:outer membrane protein OmpA-like peptidoglycan-associated protein
MPNFERRVPIRVILGLGIALSLFSTGHFVTHPRAATIIYEGGHALDAESLVSDIPPNIRKQWNNRISRLRALAQQKGVIPPTFQESIIVRPGQIPNVSHPIPVLRVAFAEQSFFDFDKANVKPNAVPTVQLISELIAGEDNGSYTLIVGHTDSTGNDEYNDPLANRRAATVLQLLVSLGIPRERLHTAGIGRRQPIAPNSTPDGRARNRRVEFFIAQSYQANLFALAQIPVRSDWVRSPSNASLPTSDVPIHNADGTTSGGVRIRPPRTIPLRPIN